MPAVLRAVGLLMAALSSAMPVTRRYLTSSNVDSTESVRIGVVLTQSECDVDTYNAVNLFTWWLNEERGGVNVSGQLLPLEVVAIGSGEESANETREAIRQLVHNESTRLLLGPCQGELGGVASDEVASIGDTVMILPSEVSDKAVADSEMIFEILPMEERVFGWVLQELAGRVPNGTIAYVTGPEGTDQAECGAIDGQAQNAGLRFVGAYNINTTEAVTSVVEKLMDEPPDIIALCSRRMHEVDFCPHFLRQARDFELPAKMIVTSHMCTDTNGKYLGEVGRWLLFLANFDVWSSEEKHLSELTGLSASEIMLMYRKVYSFTGGTDSMPSIAAAWSAMETFIMAIEASGDTNATSVTDAAYELDFGTPFTNVNFDRAGRSIGSRLAFQIDNAQSIHRVVPANSDMRFPMPSWSDRYCFQSGTLPTDEINADSVYGFGVNHDMKCQSCLTYGENYFAVYNWNPQRRECVECGSGSQVRILAGESAHMLSALCIPCGDGQVLDRATDTCITCPAGTVANGPFSCTLCMPGRYAPNSSWSDCVDCGAGRFADERGADKCKLCEPGRAAYMEGQSMCNACFLGFYGAQSGLSSCEFCPQGRASNITGMVECHKCEAGRYGAIDSRSCEECIVGTFQPAAGQTSCANALVGMEAPEKGLTSPLNLKGYWLNLRSHKAEKCASGCLTSSACETGTFGRQCHTCLPKSSSSYGYARGPLGCDPCVHPVVNAAILTALIISLSIGSLAFASLISSASEHPHHIYAVFFKQLMAYFAVVSGMTDLAAEIFEAVGEGRTTDDFLADDDIGFKIILHLKEIPQVMDGLIPLESKLWSLSCLWQASISSETYDALQSSAHDDYYKPEYDQYRAEVKAAQGLGELRLVVAWCCLPFLVIATANLIGFVRLHLDLHSRAPFYAEALEFYRNVYRRGFKYARIRYTEAKWHRFVDAYSASICHLWFPVNHIATFLSSRCVGHCNFTMFFQESTTIAVVWLFVSYSHVAKQLLRPLRCEFFGPSGEDREVLMVYSSSLNCHEDATVTWIATFASTFWLLVPPGILLFKLSQVRKRFQEKSVRRIWGLMTAGYESHRWWWEIVVYARKAVVLLIAPLPFPVTTKLDVSMVVALFFAFMHYHFAPYEDRRQNVPNRIEWYQFALWMALVMSMKIAILTHSMAWAALATVCTVVLHILYVFFMCRLTLQDYLRARKDEHAEAAAQAAAAGGRHLALPNPEEETQEDTTLPALPATKASWSKVMTATSGAWHSPSITSALMRCLTPKSDELEELPYITLEHLYGWITVQGSRGDEAQVPYIPKGMDVFDQPHGWPTLSKAPWKVTTVENNVDPDFLDRMTVMRILGNAMKKIVINVAPRATFSVSLVEFVIRAAFVVVHGEVKLANEAVPVDRQVLAKANRTCDPMLLLDGDLKESQSNKFLAKGFEVDSDMRKNNTWKLLRETQGELRGMGMSRSSFTSSTGSQSLGDVSSSVPVTVGQVMDKISRAAKSGARQLQTQGDAAKQAVTDAVGLGVTEVAADADEDDDSSGSFVEDGDEVLDPAEMLQQLDRLRIQSLVHQMYSPNVYYRGLTTQDFHTAILKVLDYPLEDLRLWLDLFERVWREERVLAARELQRQAGFILGQGIQATVGPEEEEEITYEQPAAVMRWMVLLLRMSGGGSGVGRAELLKVRDVEQLRARRFDRTRQDLQTMLELHREYRQAEEKKRREAEERLSSLMRVHGEEDYSLEVAQQAAEMRQELDQRAANCEQPDAQR